MSKKFAITDLEQQEIALIATALGELPAKLTRVILNKLEAQFNVQNAPQEPAAPAAPASSAASESTAD